MADVENTKINSRISETFFNALIIIHLSKDNQNKQQFTSLIFPPVALRPNVDHGLHVHEVSRSCTTTHHAH